jgi:hypothetical protein
MSGNGIRIAVISDTHGLLRRSVIEQLQDCSHILHAGDVIHESDLDELSLYGNLYAVCGNNDRWMRGVRDLAGFLRFQIGGVSFFMVHDRLDVPRDLGGTDVVVYGHSHRYSEEWIDGRLWLNPGSCGYSRFGGNVTMAKLTLRNGRVSGVERIELDGREE